MLEINSECSYSPTYDNLDFLKKRLTSKKRPNSISPRRLCYPLIRIDSRQNPSMKRNRKIAHKHFLSLIPIPNATNHKKKGLKKVKKECTFWFISGILFNSFHREGLFIVIILFAFFN